ncbi:hypothetical protein [Chitinophaga alhagiae]|uniref:hypothetical protein n=1 Tax=Chitinophaga alhagiae TaxID=2203219 RepID=UPI000E5B72DE|nr:hypothetical protein [Chitinophaga alhagiae]
MLNHKTFVVLCLLAMTVACKKETETAPFPYNSIQSFSIETTAAETINGAISGDSIIVYWPSYIPMPATVTPAITISENAEVTPAPGTAVDFKTGTSFTVKAQNGSAKTYFLKVAVNQPPIIVRNINLSTTKGGTIEVSTDNGILYLARDAALTKFYIIDSSGREKDLSLSFSTNPYKGNIMEIKVPDTDDVKQGAYRIKITSGTQSFISEEYRFAILYPSDKRPEADPLNTPLTVKRGNTITFTGTGFLEMKEARVYGYTPEWAEREIGTLELVSFTATTATYRVPASFPAGVYQLDGYEADGMFINLRTTDFMGFWSWSKPQKVYVPVSGSAKITITE